MSVFGSPFLAALDGAKTVLLAGAGGGFDIFCGLPLYFGLRDSGKTVHLANLSFSDLHRSTARGLTDALFEVDDRTHGSEHYFPELHLARWFRHQGERVPIYCLDRVGVRPIQDAYRFLVDRLEVDAVVLVDGGTDSLMRGDEFGLGTPEEDAASLAAVDGLQGVATKLLVCLGFGVDTHHGVCHAQFLEAVAGLGREGAFLGAWSLLPQMREVELYREAAEFVFAAMPDRPSIVSGSILDAIYGEFGDVHRSERTRGSALFINPLMGLYWAFRLEGVAKRNLYLDAIGETVTYPELSRAIIVHRSTHGSPKPWQDIPL